MQFLTKLTVYTNLFYLLPCILLLYNKFYWQGALLLVTPFASIVYHLNETNRVKMLVDYIFAVVYFIVICYLLIISIIKRPAAIENYIALAVGVVALCIKYTVGNTNIANIKHTVMHSFWHIIGAFAATIVSLSFIYGSI